MKGIIFLLCSLWFSAAFSNFKPCHENPELDPILELQRILGCSSQGYGAKETWVKFVAKWNNKDRLLSDLRFVKNKEGEFHAHYAQKEYGLTEGLKNINEKSYYAKSRELIFGVVYISGNTKWDVKNKKDLAQYIHYSINSKDHLEASEIIAVNNALKHHLKDVVFGLDDQSIDLGIIFRPTISQNKSLTSISDQLQKSQVKITNINKLLKSEGVYNEGVNVGEIKYLSLKEVEKIMNDGKNIDMTGKILVLEGSPSDVPVASGYIYSSPTVSHSHGALLSKMYDVPMVHLLDAYQEKKWPEGKVHILSSKIVKDFIEQEIVYISEGNQKTSEFINEVKKIRTLNNPEIDTKNDVVLFSGSRQSNSSEVEPKSYGSKNNGLSIINNTLPIENRVPTLHIPIFYQHDFFAKAKASTGESINDFIRKNQDNLALIRKEIKESQTNVESMNKLIKIILDTFPGESLFLRSSSNAEDGKVFNGAGLYSSKAAIVEGIAVRDSIIQIIKDAVKEVWSSLYNDGAVLARKKFGLDLGFESTDRKIGMGIVVQSFIEPIISQGVTIFEKDADLGYGMTGNTITTEAFPGKHQVTNPKNGEKPEKTFFDNDSFQVKQECELTGENSNQCKKGMRIVSQSMSKTLLYSANKLSSFIEGKLDIEWILTENLGKKELKIVQVRPVPEKQTLEQMIVIPQENVKLKIGTEGDSSQPAITQLMQKIDLQISFNQSFGFSDQTIKNIIAKKDEFEIKVLNKTYEAKNTDEVTHHYFSNQGIAHIWTYDLDYLGGSQFEIIYVQEKNSKNSLIDASGFKYTIISKLKKSLPKLPSSSCFNSIFENENGETIKNKRCTRDIFSYNYNHPANEEYFNDMIKTELHPVKNKLLRSSPTHLTINMNGKIKNEDKKIVIKVNYNTDNGAKNGERHAEFLLKNIIISGLIDDDIIISEKDNGISYAAGDHHPDPEYAIDLSKAKVLKNNQEVDLDQFAGRYLWIISNYSNYNYKTEEVKKINGGMFFIEESLNVISVFDNGLPKESNFH